MKFTLKMDLRHEADQDPVRLARILRDVAERVRDGYTGDKIYNPDGNWIGKYGMTND